MPVNRGGRCAPTLPPLSVAEVIDNVNVARLLRLDLLSTATAPNAGPTTTWPISDTQKFELQQFLDACSPKSQ